MIFIECFSSDIILLIHKRYYGYLPRIISTNQLFFSKRATYTLDISYTHINFAKILLAQGIEITYLAHQSKDVISKLLPYFVIRYRK